MTYTNPSPVAEAYDGDGGLPADVEHGHGMPPFFAPTGLTGMTTASRYVGAVNGSAPASGTFQLGDWGINTAGAIIICTVAGTPGTWVAPAGPAVFSALTAVALTDAATILVNAALGNLFRVILGGNRTLGAPTNPTDGQTIDFEITQDGTGSRTLAYASAYEFSTTLASPTLSTAAGKVDLLSFRYSSVATKWRCKLINLGFTS
jgi:hypothetical protein